jgi:hypothetical protein
VANSGPSQATLDEIDEYIKEQTVETTSTSIADGAPDASQGAEQRKFQAGQGMKNGEDDAGSDQMESEWTEVSAKHNTNK